MSECCRVCGKTEEEHRDLESRGILNHQFSEDGSLTAIDRSPKKQPKSREVLVVPGVDMALRKLLIRKGILTDDDFADAGAFGAVVGGDRDHRPTSESLGSMRPSPSASSYDGPGPYEPCGGDPEPESPAC